MRATPTPFFRQVLATCLGGLLLIGILLTLLLLAPTFLGGTSSGRPKPNSFLRITLKGRLVEHTSRSPLQELLSNEVAPRLSLASLKRALRRAAKDDNVRGVVLHIDQLQCGWTSLRELRNALLTFKEKSKKSVTAYSTCYTTKTYYLACVAHYIGLHPEGLFLLNGLSSSRMFYQHMLEKLAIKPIVFRVGKYKSAVEPFLQNDFSEASRHQTTCLVKAIEQQALKAIAQQRPCTVAQLRQWANTLAIKGATVAQQYQLVDKVGYPDDLEVYLKKMTKLPQGEKVCYSDFEKYDHYLQRSHKHKHRNKVAILVAEGEIVTGKSKANVRLGAEDFAKTIDQAREDDDVKAIVVRINSPGGSVVASDQIWHALLRAKAKKPVIASMGDVAASGGYYMASACSTIFAHPTTITGSIGVFGLFFDTTLLRQKLGLTTRTVQTAPSADLLQVDALGLHRALTQQENAFFQQMVNQHYDRFLQKVSVSRNLTLRQVHTLAQGRVWAGLTAKQKGLIDQLGGLKAAIVHAAQAAKLEKHRYEVTYYPQKRSLLQELTTSMEEATVNALRAYAPVWIQAVVSPQVETYATLQQLQGYQARLPYTLQVG